MDAPRHPQNTNDQPKPYEPSKNGNRHPVPVTPGKGRSRGHRQPPSLPRQPGLTANGYERTRIKSHAKTQSRKEKKEQPQIRSTSVERCPACEADLAA